MPPLKLTSIVAKNTINEFFSAERMYEYVEKLAKNCLKLFSPSHS